MTPASQKKLLKFLVCLGLAVITAVAFAGVSHCSFIALDDRVYVVANPNVQHGFSWAAIKWAFSGFHAGYWIPLTWLSHILDCQLFGLNPAGHHLMNLAFHIANVILLFLLLENLTAKLWPSAFAALLFAIHPMHVESVAWIAERKDVLSAFFFLLALLAYGWYVSLSQLERAGVPLYLLTLLLFALGLMAKPMLVTLPLVLLLLDYWPFQRFNFSTLQPVAPNLATAGKGGTIRHPQSAIRILLEKLPFFILSGLSCLLTWFSVKASGAIKSADAFTPFQRLAHVPVSYAWYVLKLFWPANLSVFYPLRTDLSIPQVLLTSVFLIVLTGIALACIRKCPAVFIGWLWFIIMLLPVIGLLQAGDQAYADRFTYLPYIGLFIALAWGVGQAFCLPVGAASSRQPPDLPAKTNRPIASLSPSGERVGVRGRLLLFSVALLIAAGCFWRTVVEVQYWKDGLTLFNRAIALDPRNDMAWMSLGSEYSNRGNYARAITCLTRATTLNPASNLAWYYLGKLLAHQGDYADAQNAYQTSLQYASFQGDRIETYNDLGDALASAGQYDRAIAAYQNSLALSAAQPDTQAKIGQCCLQSQLPDQAAAAFQAALALQPDNGAAHLGLGAILQGQGRDAEALAHYRQALSANPNSLMALNNLAWLLATDADSALRNGAEAVTLAGQACEQTRYQKAFLIGTLAAAYAQAGRFDDAIAAAQKACDIAQANGQTDLASRNAQLLQLYQSHKAFHQPPNH